MRRPARLFTTETQRHREPKDKSKRPEKERSPLCPIVTRHSPLVTGGSLCLCVSLVSLAFVILACRRRGRPPYAVVPQGPANALWQTLHAGAAAGGQKGRGGLG